MDYWLHVRRALARQCVDRIGLGGYLHLTQDFPAFVDTITEISDQFRSIKALHMAGAPAELPVTVGILTTWGSLRSWTLSGHFHETNTNVLIHVLEALSGLPVSVRFLSFEDLPRSLSGIQVLINAGAAGDAWSGGDAWKDPELSAAVTRFVHEGGSLIGFNEPSAVPGLDTNFALAHLFGIDLNTGDYACHLPWDLPVSNPPVSIPEDTLGHKTDLRVLSPDVEIWASENGIPQMTRARFGKGQAIYLSGFHYSPQSARMLLDLIVLLTGVFPDTAGTADLSCVETAWYPASQTLLLMNNSDQSADTRVAWPAGHCTVHLAPFETCFLENPAPDA